MVIIKFGNTNRYIKCLGDSTGIHLFENVDRDTASRLTQHVGINLANAIRKFAPDVEIENV